MTEGKGKACDTEWMYPLPFITRVAFSARTMLIARYVEVMLMGWKFAFNTNTASFMAHQIDYISFGEKV